MDNEPFQCKTTIGNLQTPRYDALSASHDRTQSKTPVSDEHTAKSFCSICTNFVTGVDVFSPNLHITAAQWDGPTDVTALSEFHYSIHKPPQNLLG